MAEEIYQAALDAAGGFLADHSGLTARGTGTSANVDLNSFLTDYGELGFLGIGLPHENGGSGGTIELAGRIAELAGSELVHGLILHQAVAAFLATRIEAPISEVEDITSGRRPTLVAWAEGMQGDGGRLAVPFPLNGAALLLLTASDGSAQRYDADGYELSCSDGGWLNPLWEEGVATCPSDYGTPRSYDRSAERACRAFADGLSSMYMLGTASRALQDTTAYVKARRQFGVPVGSFQAVKHHLADAEILRVHARATVLGELSRFEAENGLVDMSVAKLTASDAALDIAERCLQACGGYGFTWESNVHLHLKSILRLRQWPLPLLSVKKHVRQRLLKI